MNTGGPVTIVVDGLLVHAQWREHNGHHVYYRRGVAGRVDVPSVALKDEGITWVRGHVSEHSDEGRALLAAEALKGGTRVSSTDNDLWMNPRIGFRDVLGGRR